MHFISAIMQNAYYRSRNVSIIFRGIDEFT